MNTSIFETSETVMALPLVDDTLFIDNTALETFTTCPKQAEYYLLGKREKSAERSALKFGGILHKVLEKKYLNLDKPVAEQTALMFAECTTQFESYTAPDNDHRTYDTAIGFIQKYQDLYALEPFTVATSPSGLPLVEIPFAIPLAEYPINQRILVREPDGTILERFVATLRVCWQGRIDLIYTREGRYYGLDHKSTSMMGPTYFREFDLSSQVKGYSWACRHLLGSKPEAFIINALGIRKPSKTGTPFEFVRHTVPILDAQLDEWLGDTTAIISDFLAMFLRSHFPRHTKWCVGKYGECQYYNVCVLPKEQRHLMLATGDYKPVTWSPLD